MIKLPKNLKVLVATKPVDMRKAIDGLCMIIADHLNKSPQDAALYVFYNKQRNKLKALLWNDNGFLMIYKRLEQGRFKLPRKMTSDTLMLDEQQLRWLLAGLDFTMLSKNPALMFTAYS